MKGVNVEIMGQSLVVASDGGDEWARSLAATVDEKDQGYPRQRSIREFNQPGDSGGAHLRRRT